MKELITGSTFASFRGNLLGHVISSAKALKASEATEDDRDAYDASNAAYGSVEHHDKLLKKGYTQDEELSNDNTRVYAHDRHTLVAYRGTVHDKRDYMSDAAIAGGHHTKDGEFVKALEHAKRVAEKHKKPVVYTGHSLGGTKAVESARVLGGKSVVFNPGSSYTKPLDTSHAVVHRTNRDYISYNLRGGRINTYRGGHALCNFSFLE